MSLLILKNREEIEGEVLPWSEDELSPSASQCQSDPTLTQAEVRGRINEIYPPINRLRDRGTCLFIGPIPQAQVPVTQSWRLRFYLRAPSRRTSRSPTFEDLHPASLLTAG